MTFLRLVVATVSMLISVTIAQALSASGSSHLIDALIWLSGGIGGAMVVLSMWGDA